MSYVTTVNPTLSEQVWYHGSRGNTCPGPITPRYYWGTYPVESGYVTSWRGRRDYGTCREFDRFRYKVSGPLACNSCNRSNKVDGGDRWMLGLIQGHVLSNPSFDLKPDKFIISEDDSKYRDFQVNELFAKANEPIFGAATFFAELGESIYYISDAIKTLLRITKFTKSVIHRGANPHEAWLEWRYAIQPLMLTVQDVLEALEPHRPKEKVQTYKKYKPVKDSGNFRFTYNEGVHQFSWRSETRYTCGAALWITFQDDRSPWGTSLHDVIQAGWEIVPLSFVFDWFIDVGQWLAALRDTNLDIGQRYATLTKNKTVELWVDEDAGDQLAYYENPMPGDPLRVTGFHMNRIIGEDVTPSNLPCLDPSKLSLVRRLDALSLLTGLLLGLRR